MELRAEFIGEEPLVSGFLLLGIPGQEASSGPDSRWRQLVEARARCDLLILSAAFAGGLRDRLDALLVDAALPPVVVLPEIGVSTPSRAISRARRSLGLEEV